MESDTLEQGQFACDVLHQYWYLCHNHSLWGVETMMPWGEKTYVQLPVCSSLFTSIIHYYIDLSNIFI